MAPRAPAATALVPDEAFADAATALVGAGRIVPGLTVEAGGRARSWWWPLPAASHRSLLAALVEDPSPDGQRRAAGRLAGAVDDVARRRLVAAQAVLAGRRSGRPGVQEAWARSLVSPDPWLAPALDQAKVRALAAEIQAWVRSGAVVGGRVRLCLRVHEPQGKGARDQPGAWRVELLAQDRDEPSLVVPLSDVWEGRAQFGPSVVESTLASLGRLARLAPELAGLLEGSAPTELAVDDRTIVTVLRDRAEALDDAGIGVLLPSWWSRPARLGLRARASGSAPASGAVVAGDGGMDAIVSFSWEAALGQRRLTQADLDMLARAGEAQPSLVRVRGQWVEVDPEGIGDLLGAVGAKAEARAAELLRAGLGLDRLDAPGRL